MPLTRLPKWDTRLLHAYILARASMAFQYGPNDCCSFACSGIAAFTGTNIAEGFGSYKTANGALKAIKTVTGGSTVEDAAVWCATKYEMTEYKSALFAQRGDLVLAKDVDLLMCLVSLNGRELLAPGEQGLKRLPLTAGLRAWRVG